MENAIVETPEDLRDQWLLDRMGAMIEKMGNSLEAKLEAKLNAKLDEKFASLDPLFGAIQESFLAVDEKFKSMDGKMSALQLSMIDVQEKVGVLTEDVAGIKVTLNSHTKVLDAISKRMDKWDKEFPIMSHNVLRIDRWVTKAAPIVGVKYAREPENEVYPGVDQTLPS